MKANATLATGGFPQQQARQRIGAWIWRLAIALVPVVGMLAGQDSSTHAARARFVAQPRAVAAYYDSADGTRQALVASDSHTLTEVYWSGNAPAGKGPLATFASPIVAVAGYYDSADNSQHAIVATGNGTVTEVYWGADGWVHQRTLTTFASSIVGIGAYYDSAENSQHAIVATGTTLTEVYWGPTVGMGRGTLTTFGSRITAVAGYYVSPENTQHAIASTADGKVTEVYWGPTVGMGQNTLATFASAGVAVSGYYDSADYRQHVIVARVTDSINHRVTVTELYWYGGGSVFQDTLTTMYGVEGVGAFYAGDDNSQHAVLETDNNGFGYGVLYDLFWQTGSPTTRFLAS